MESVTDFIKFLKSRKSYHARKARQIVSVNPDAAKKHEQTGSKHGEIIDWLESYEANPSCQSSPADDDLFSLNPLDMQSLPEDLSVELSVSQSDTEDAQILELLRIANRSLDLNEILIGCYRKYDIKHKRNLLTARIYRLIKRDLAHNVGKGTYALGPAPEEEVSFFAPSGGGK
ncbi:MAG: hypothetical protein L3J28_09400 [Candidatus Polarisedimenticolaceae bacterium]|nr:hypothetical protein [Candidatus Polarisedimenticolaceae bacterium]